MTRIVHEGYKLRNWQKRIAHSGSSIRAMEVLGYVSRNGKDLLSEFVDCRLAVNRRWWDLYLNGRTVGPDPEVWGDGEEVQDAIYVDDMVAAMMRGM